MCVLTAVKRHCWHLAMLLCLGVLSACNVTQPEQPSEKADRGHVIRPKPIGQNILSSYTGSYALLIGESNYSHWDSLETIPTELKLVEKVLKAQGFVVEKALDLNAVQLRARFEQFINKYGFKASHRLLFYFGGHGYTRKYKGYDKGYIVPIDAPDPETDETGFLRKAISMDQIYAWASGVQTLVCAIRDTRACYSPIFWKVFGLF